MRIRALRNMVGGGLLCLCLAVSACHRGETPNAEEPLPGPMPGWKVSFQTRSQTMRRVSFTPTQRAVGREKMWALILQDPAFLTSSTKELIETFRPKQICKTTNLNVIRQNYADMLYEEHDSGCWKHDHSLTIGRIARGEHSVSFIAYHADVEDLPPDKKADLIKYMDSARLDTSAKEAGPAATGSAVQQSSPVATAAP